MKSYHLNVSKNLSIIWSRIIALMKQRKILLTSSMMTISIRVKAKANINFGKNFLNLLQSIQKVSYELRLIDFIFHSRYNLSEC